MGSKVSTQLQQAEVEEIHRETGCELSNYCHTIIYLVIYLVRPNQSTFRVGLGPSGHQSMSETFFIFLRSSNLFLNMFTEPAEITSSLRLFHLFTIL